MKRISHFYLFPKLECGELFVCAIIRLQGAMLSRKMTLCYFY
jgi:hypothetical protein